MDYEADISLYKSNRQISVCRAVGAKIAINVVNFWSIFANLT